MEQYLSIKNKERDEKIIDLYIKGLKQYEIGKIFNVCQVTVSHVIRKNNIKRNKYYGKDNSNWRDGIMYDNKRKLIYSLNHPKPDFLKKYCYEYKLIVEKHLGRYLKYYGRNHKDNEIVHHINGDETDNRIENLQVVTRKEHILLHQKNGSMSLLRLNKGKSKFDIKYNNKLEYRKQYNKIYRQKNKIKILQQKKIYRQKNIEEIRKKALIYRQKNKKEILKNQQDRRRGIIK